jgi:flagellar biosynthesis protein FlhA
MLPVGIIVCFMVILVPLPATLMDFLLVGNIAVGTIVLLTAIHVKTPLEYSVFPTVLLATTLSRLVLNVATTRLILTKAADDGMYAAGTVVQTFGQFIAGDQIVVGLVIFSIIIVIQFAVITKGATRISEVTARFVLDAMPGRQMAIDADVSAGIIDPAEARIRREEIVQQADFYGAMDGASKFIRGDAVAGVFITLINIVGGLLLGVLHYGMSPAEAASVFTKLTIGDGLVTQIPALLISLAAGMLVTRSTQRVNLPAAFIGQTFARPQVLAVAASFLGFMILTSLPKVPLIMIGSCCAGIALALSRQEQPVEAKPIDRSKTFARQKIDKQHRAEPRIEEFLAVEPVELELGLQLIGFADSKRGGNLLSRVNRLRQTLAAEMGIILPKVRIRDNLQLKESEYRILINGSVIVQATLPKSGYAAWLPEVRGASHFTPFRHPVVPAGSFEIPAADQAEIELSSGIMFDSISLLAQHLQQVVVEHADGLLTRDATKHLIDELAKSSPAIVQELIPNILTLGQVQRVLRGLLVERVSIRQLGLILESLSEFGQLSPFEQIEAVRKRLARNICQAFRDKTGRLHVVTLDPNLENRIERAIIPGSEPPSISLPAERRRAISEAIGREVAHLEEPGRPPIVLVNPRIRPHIRPLVRHVLPNLIALAYDEITDGTRIVSVGIVGEPGSTT